MKASAWRRRRRLPSRRTSRCSRDERAGHARVAADAEARLPTGTTRAAPPPARPAGLGADGDERAHVLPRVTVAGADPERARPADRPGFAGARPAAGADGQPPAPGAPERLHL